MKIPAKSRSQKLNFSSKKYELLERLRREAGLDDSSNHQIPKRDNRSSYPLSFAQKRLWFLQSLNPGQSLL